MDTHSLTQYSPTDITAFSKISCITLVFGILSIISGGLHNYYSHYGHKHIFDAYYKLGTYETYYEPAQCMFHGQSVIDNTTNQMINIIAVTDNGSIITNGTLDCVSDKIHNKIKYNSRYNCSIITNTFNLKSKVNSFDCLIPTANISITNNTWIYKINFKDDILNARYGYALYGYISQKLIIISIWLMCISYTSWLLHEVYIYMENKDLIYIKLPEDTKCMILFDNIKHNQTYFKCRKCVCVIDYKTFLVNYNHYKRKNCCYCNTYIENDFNRYINAK